MGTLADGTSRTTSFSKSPQKPAIEVDTSPEAPLTFHLADQAQSAAFIPSSSPRDQSRPPSMATDILSLAPTIVPP